MIQTFKLDHLKTAKTAAHRTARHLLETQAEHPDDWRDHVDADLENSDRLVRDDAVLGGVVVITGRKLIYLTRLHSDVVAVVREAL